MADALVECNENLVVHRDIKPANILLTADLKPKICDFGLSKRLRSSEELMETKLISMPKEAQYGMEIDLWSFGVMLYQTVTGHLPFDDNTTLLNLPCVRLSPHCLDLIKKLLDKDSDNRLQFSAFFAHPFTQSDAETYQEYIRTKMGVKNRGT